jgi:hypothetical protein
VGSATSGDEPPEVQREPATYVFVVTEALAEKVFAFVEDVVQLELGEPRNIP